MGVTASGLSKSFGHPRRRALDGVTLTVRPGEAMGVIGANGAGKTTLMGCLLGLLRPDEGEVRIGGFAPSDLRVLRRVGYVPERFQFDRWTTGWRFLEWHHKLSGLPREEVAANITRVIGIAGLSEAAVRRRVAHFSKGMQQRLLIAQALLPDPDILFLDEFTSGVDPAGVMAMRECLLHLKARGTTLVMNSHRLEEVERICDRVAFLRSGRLESLFDTALRSEGPGVIRVEWSHSSDSERPAPERLSEIASRVNVRLESSDSAGARFLVEAANDRAALLAALHEAGVRILAAQAEAPRLEWLFDESRSYREKA